MNVVVFEEKTTSLDNETNSESLHVQSCFQEITDAQVFKIVLLLYWDII